MMDFILQAIAKTLRDLDSMARVGVAVGRSLVGGPHRWD